MNKSIALIALLLLSINSAEAIGSWNQKSNIPAQGRHRTTGFSIGNKGYIGLGHFNSGPLGNVTKSDIWEYSPADGSWTQKADYAGGATYGATAFTIGTKAYVGAHVYGGQEFFSFDPVLNIWAPIANCPNGASDRTSFAIGEFGYFVGASTLNQYDPATDSWTTKASPGSVGAWSKSFSLDEKGYLLTTGGAFYEYKPGSDQWTVRAYFPGEAVGGWSTFAFDGLGYVTTGYIAFLNPTSRETWQYNPQTNEWTRIEDLPGSTRRFSSSFSIGDKGYLGTGTNGTNLNDFWEFDPAYSSIYEENIIGVSIYPNPSVDYINFSFEKMNLADDIKLNIFSLSGQLKKSIQITDNSLKIMKSELGTGTFIYSLSNRNQTIKTGKISFI